MRSTSANLDPQTSGRRSPELRYSLTTKNKGKRGKLTTAAAVAVTLQLAHQAHQAQTVWMAQMAQKDHQAETAQMLQQDYQLTPASGASNANQHKTDQWAEWDRKDPTVWPAQRVWTELQVFKAQQVTEDHEDHQDHAVLLEKEDRRAQQDKPKKSRDHQAQPEHQELEDQLDHQDHQAVMVAQAIQDQWAQLVWLVPTVQPEQWVLWEWLELTEQPAILRTALAALHLSALQASSRRRKRF